MPGRHVTDHQMRLFMQFRQTDTVAAASAKASFSTATGHRLARDPWLPSTRKEPRGRRRPAPLGGLFDAEIIPMLKAELSRKRSFVNRRCDVRFHARKLTRESHPQPNLC